MSIFATEVLDEGSSYYELTGMGYGALIAIMLLILLLGCFLSNPTGKKKLSIKALVFSAMAIALAMVTSMIKLIDMPMGGSVTLCSMLFVCLIGYLFGLRTGLMAAIAYGFLQLVVDPYIISIPQMLTDYIFAFGALGIAGVFSNRKYGLIKGYLRISFWYDLFRKLRSQLQYVCTCVFARLQWCISGIGGVYYDCYFIASASRKGACTGKKHDTRIIAGQ